MLKRHVVTLLAGLGLAVVASAASAQESQFKIVVSSQNPVGLLSRDEAAKLFLRKTSIWQDGKPVLPVELPEASAVRHAFTHSILGKDMDALKNFWQQSIFSGRAVPPPERDSDADVLDYIRKYPGAIGYVSASTPLSADVKVVTVR